MSDQTDKPDDYEVGYGKPPKHGQFKPGQSGNPKGRPKGRESFPVLLEKCLNRRTRIKVAGETRNVPVLEAIVMRLVHEMAHGPTDKVIAILKMIKPMLEAETPAAIPLEVIEEALTADEMRDFADLYDKIEEVMEERGLGGISA